MVLIEVVTLNVLMPLALVRDIDHAEHFLDVIVLVHIVTGILDDSGVVYNAVSDIMIKTFYLLISLICFV